MKKSYHIIINKHEEENLIRVLKDIGVSEESRITENFLGSADSANKVHYIVQLTKYELLLTRLSSICGEVMKIN